MGKWGRTISRILAAAVLAGCAGAPVDSADDSSRVDRTSKSKSSAKKIQKYLTPQALDQVTRGYADHYVSLVASACGKIIDSDAPLPARVTAMRMRSYGCSAIWDIVTNADPFTRLIDLLVVVSLESSIWIDGALADDVFGERADEIVLALRQARERIWDIAERTMQPDLLRQLDGMIWRWRAEHPEVAFAGFVRFAEFADSRGKTAIQTARGKGLFKAVDTAREAAEEIRLMGERMFYMSKRWPILLTWQAQLATAELMMQPEIQLVLKNQDRVVESIEGASVTIREFPELIASERKAILDGAESMSDQLVTAAKEYRALMADADKLVASLQKLVETSNVALGEAQKTVGGADKLVARFDEPEGEETEPSRPFDITEYTQTVQELTTALQEANKLLDSTEALLQKELWDKRLREITSAADRGIEGAADSGRGVVTGTLIRAIIGIAAFFALLALYKTYAVRIVGRSRRP